MLLVTCQGPMLNRVSALSETCTTRPALPPHALSRYGPDRIHRGPDPQQHAEEREDRRRVQPTIQEQAQAEPQDNRYRESQPQVEDEAKPRLDRAARTIRPRWVAIRRRLSPHRVGPRGHPPCVAVAGGCRPRPQESQPDCRPRNP